MNGPKVSTRGWETKQTGISIRNTDVKTGLVFKHETDNDLSNHTRKACLVCTKVVLHLQATH